MPRRPASKVTKQDPTYDNGERTSRLGVLAPDTEAPVVPETTVRTDLLQPLKVITELGVDAVRQDLRVLAVDDVLLPVQEPGGDLELGRVLHNGDYPLELIRVELASPTIPLCEDVKC